MLLPVESLGHSLDDAAANAQPKGEDGDQRGIVGQMEQNELEGEKEKKEKEGRPTERF